MNYDQLLVFFKSKLNSSLFILIMIVMLIHAKIGSETIIDDYIKFGNVEVPTLLIWGNMDMAIGRKSVELSEKYMKGPYNLVELYAGHWLIQEDFDKVSNEIMKHLKKYSSSYYETHLRSNK